MTSNSLPAPERRSAARASPPRLRCLRTGFNQTEITEKDLRGSMTLPNWYWSLSSRLTPRWEIFSPLVIAGEQGWMRGAGRQVGSPVRSGEGRAGREESLRDWERCFLRLWPGASPGSFAGVAAAQALLSSGFHEISGPRRWWEPRVCHSVVPC